MRRTLSNVVSEFMPKWMRHKDSAANPREEAADETPMPAATWKPEVEKTPLDPAPREDAFDNERDDDREKPSDPRGGFTPRAG